MKLLLTFIVLACICISCNSDYPYTIRGTVTIDTTQYPAVWYTNSISFKEDTAFYINSDSSVVKIYPPYVIKYNKFISTDCQFNCYVTNIHEENDSVTAYVTECGLYFYSSIPYHIGDTLFKYSSPKHN